uniref:Uncharacterized protein n=1 Tax=Arundo donax TaxID=35708 RepID=A0A0A8ZIG3_ARUDO
MAHADAGDYLLDEDDEDFFADFNAHPYRGGYDLATTYGSPLPPSANTCYPVSPPAAAATLPAQTSINPEPTDPPLEEEEVPREPVYESPVFQNGAGREGKVRKRGWCGRGLWRKCVLGLNYLSGYSDPFGERRIAMDSYVVPAYANRKGNGEDALAVKV